MSALQIEFAGQLWSVDLHTAHDLAIPMAFGGPQPNHFGAQPASAEPMRGEGFIGDVARGGNCNVSITHSNIHCNGTHTECVGHITAGLAAIGDLVIAPRPAMLISIEVTAGQPVEAAALAEVLERLPESVDALVVRTLPNTSDKALQTYDRDEPPTWFGADAMSAIVDTGIKHLITDLPSVDAYDDQALSAHRVFWAVPPDGVIADPGVADRPDATITELVFVPDQAADGLYWLDLGVARYLCDAAPSRPILYPLVPRGAGDEP
jgi:kynurenine formamidase